MPKNENLSIITTKCENGVLTMVVEKLPPPNKPKTVEVTFVLNKILRLDGFTMGKMKL